MGEMASESRMGAMMPAAVIAATDTEPIARCRTAAMNHASRMLSRTGAPVILSVLLAWFIAALLHLAIGSVSVAAITAAGIIAPILDSLAISPIAVGLAIASGAMFALQVNSNFFWMFKSLLGLSTKGTLKTLTLVTSVASVVSLPLVMLAAVVL